MLIPLSCCLGWTGVATAPRMATVRVPPARCELGLQVDPAASVGSVVVLSGFALLQLKVRSAISRREARDAAAELLRKAEVLQLAGKLSAEEVERQRKLAADAWDEYEAARQLGVQFGVQLRLPDPNRADAQRLLERQPAPPEDPLDGTPLPPDALDGIRAALGLENRAERQPDKDLEPTSLLPSGSSSVTLKDVAIGLAFILQLAWFALSLTDPLDRTQPSWLDAALTSGGEMVDQREAWRATQEVGVQERSEP